MNQKNLSVQNQFSPALTFHFLVTISGSKSIPQEGGLTCFISPVTSFVCSKTIPAPLLSTFTPVQNQFIKSAICYTSPIVDIPSLSKRNKGRFDTAPHKSFILNTRSGSKSILLIGPSTLRPYFSEVWEQPLLRFKNKKRPPLRSGLPNDVCLIDYLTTNWRTMRPLAELIIST